MARQGWQGCWRLGDAVGAAGAQVVELVLSRDPAVVQGKAAGAASLPAQGGGGFVEIAVNPIGMAHFGHGGLIWKGKGLVLPEWTGFTGRAQEVLQALG